MPGIPVSNAAKHGVIGLVHPEAIWKSAMNFIWGNGSCVEDSTGEVGSLEDKRSKKGQRKIQKPGSDEGSEKQLGSGAARVLIGWNMLAMVITFVTVSL